MLANDGETQFEKSHAILIDLSDCSFKDLIGVNHFKMYYQIRNVQLRMEMSRYEFQNLQ